MEGKGRYEKCPGWTYRRGLDIFVSKNIAFNFEFRYFWADSDICETLKIDNTIPSPHPRKGKIDLDSWMVGVGIKFYFGLPHR